MLAHIAGVHRARLESYAGLSIDGWSCSIQDLAGEGTVTSLTYLNELTGEDTRNIADQGGADLPQDRASEKIEEVKGVVVDQGVLSWTATTIPTPHTSTVTLQCDIVSTGDSEGSSESFRSLGPVPSTLLWDGVRRCLNTLLSTSTSHSAFTTLVINMLASTSQIDNGAERTTDVGTGTRAVFRIRRDDSVGTVVGTVSATDIMGLLPFALVLEKQSPIPEADIPMLCPVLTRVLTSILNGRDKDVAELLALVFCAERIEAVAPSGSIMLRRESLPAATSSNNLALLALTRLYLVNDLSYTGEVVSGCTMSMSLIWGLLGTTAARHARSRRWLNLLLPQASSLYSGLDLARLLDDLQLPHSKVSEVHSTVSEQQDTPHTSIQYEGDAPQFDSIGDTGLPSNTGMGSLSFSHSNDHSPFHDDVDYESAMEVTKALKFPEDMCSRLLVPIVATAMVDDTLPCIAESFQPPRRSPLPTTPGTSWMSLLGNKRPRDEDVVEGEGDNAAADESVLLFDLLAKRDTKPAPKRGGKKKPDPQKSVPDAPLSSLRGLCANVRPVVSQAPIAVVPFQQIVWGALQSMINGGHSARTSGKLATTPVCSLVSVIPATHSGRRTAEDGSDDEEYADGGMLNDVVVVKIDFARVVGALEGGPFTCHIVGLENDGFELLQSFEITDQMMVVPSGMVKSEGPSADPRGLSCSLPASLSAKAPLLQSVQVRHEDYLVATSHPIQVMVHQREKDAGKYAYHTYDERGTSMKVEAYIPPPLDVDPQGALALASLLASYNSVRQDTSTPTTPTADVEGFPTTSTAKRGLVSAHYSTRIKNASSYRYVSCIAMPTANAPFTPHITLSQRFLNCALGGACSHLTEMGLFGKNSVSAQNARALIESSDEHRVSDTSHLIYDVPVPTVTWEYGEQVSDFLSSRCIVASTHKKGGHSFAAYIRKQLQCYLSSSHQPDLPLKDVLKLLHALRLLKSITFPSSTRRSKSGVPRLVDASRALSVVYGRALRSSAAPPSCPMQTRVMAFVFMVLSGDQLPEKDTKVGIFNRPEPTELDPNARPTLRQLFRGGVLSKAGVQDVIRTAAKQMGGSSLASLLTGNTTQSNTASSSVPLIPTGRSSGGGMMCVVKDPMVFGSFLDHTFFLPPSTDSTSPQPPLFGQGGCPESIQIQLAWILLQVVVSRLDRIRMLIDTDGHPPSVLPVVSAQLLEMHVLQWAASRFSLSADPSTGRVPSPQYAEGYLVPSEVRKLFEYGSSLCSSFGQTV